ncbi:MAG: NosD domain-containing protein [Methanosarcinaceae archaeon]|nr:NosD domain-containing protein [Methanosarcinaceae archaeon]
MSQKTNVLLILIVLLLTTPMAVAQTIIVDIARNGDYTSIGDAVANADTGDTIRVMPGVYSENVKVDRQVNLVAEGDVIVRPASVEAHTFHIAADNVTIDGFRIEREEIPFGAWDAGILLDSADNVTVINNVVSGHTRGIDLDFSNNNVLENNSVSNNVDGIFLHVSFGNTLRNNTMQSNHFNFGAYTFNGNMDNDIGVDNLVNGKPIYYLVNRSNIVLDSSVDCGTIYCINCNNISVMDQIIGDNTYGLFLYNSEGVVLDNITISDTMTGVYSYGSSGILLNNSVISGSVYEGVNFMESDDSVVANNTIFDNEIGFNLYYSSDNLVYNNLFNNMVNVVSEGGMNTWNTTLTNSTNIAGSLWLGGNVWSMPDGKGFSQKSVDKDRNNISDVSYQIPNDGVDELPIFVGSHEFSILYSLKIFVSKVLSLF